LESKKIKNSYKKRKAHRNIAGESNNNFIRQSKGYNNINMGITEI